jgi:hypothetical protein
MDMGEDQGVEACRRDGKWLPVPVKIIPFLKLPAINENTEASPLKAIA